MSSGGVSTASGINLVSLCARACARRLLTYPGAAHLPWTSPPSRNRCTRVWRGVGVSLLVPQCALLLLSHWVACIVRFHL